MRFRYTKFERYDSNFNLLIKDLPSLRTIQSDGSSFAYPRFVTISSMRYAQKVKL